MSLTEKQYIEALEKAHEDPESFSAVRELIRKHFSMIDHMKETSLYDVYEYEKRIEKALFDPCRMMAFDNERLKKEVNSLRRELGKIDKYKET